MKEAADRRMVAMGLPEDAAANECMLAGARLHAAGEREAALAAFERAALHSPAMIDAWMAIATLRTELGRPAGALDACNKGLALAPDDPEVLCNTALLLQRAGDYPAALFMLDKSLKTAPENATAWLAKGQMLAARQQLDDADEAYRRCLRVSPAELRARYGLADIAIASGEFVEAEKLLRELIEGKPGWTSARLNLAIVLAASGRESEASALLAEVVRDDPDGAARFRPVFAADQPYARAVLETPRFRVAMDYPAIAQCDWRRRREFVSWLIGRIPGGNGLAPLDDPDLPFTALGFDVGPELRRQLARNVAKRISQTAKPRIKFRARPPEGRLRLGYLTGDMRPHPIGYLMSGLFELHDHERFDVHVYDSGPPEDNEFRCRARQGASVYREIGQLPARAQAELLAADGIQIAVDLSGYTLFNSLAALACRPAPVQVSYMGYFGTLGADFIDYQIVDRYAVTADQRRHWDERLVYMPGTSFFCAGRPGLPDTGMTRAECGLPERGIVFCCHNAPWKIEPELFDLWMNILKRVPDSVLWLFDGDSMLVRRNLSVEAVQRGVDPDRLVFAGKLDYQGHLRRYRLADLVLNTLYYSGNTTSVEALALGVPVLSYSGVEMPARVAAGLLLQSGLSELVTHSPQEYEEVAVAFARDPEFQRAIRAKAALAGMASPVFDGRGRVRLLEMAYEKMWQRYRRREAPADFDVMEG